MKDEDKKLQNRKRKATGDAPEIGVVRIFSDPGPDAPDRLRRLLSLMVRYAAAGETTSPETHSPRENDGQAEEK